MLDTAAVETLQTPTFLQPLKDTSQTDMNLW